MEKSNSNLPIKPDFMIIGAMKCGTSTLHKILSSFPEIFIPNGEPHLFSLDDFEQFPQAHWAGRWIEQDFEKYFDEYISWYSGLFIDAKKGQIIGEDSAHYIASKIAIDRISEYLPDVKIIIMLRDPVDRIYSQYWHWVKTGRATSSFEDTIRFQHGNLLHRSCYEEQIKYCYSKIKNSNIKIVIFEEFVANQEFHVKSVIDFLDFAKVKSSFGGNVHANKGEYPKSLTLELFKNRALKKFFGKEYLKKLPRIGNVTEKRIFANKIERIIRRINPYSITSCPNMNESTRRFLSNQMYKRNKGLPSLLNKDLAALWPSFRK